MDDDELRRGARASGIHPADLPSLEQVERRRTELWALSSLLLVGLTVVLAGLALWSPEDRDGLLSLPVFPALTRSPRCSGRRCCRHRGRRDPRAARRRPGAGAADAATFRAAAHALAGDAAAALTGLDPRGGPAAS